MKWIIVPLAAFALAISLSCAETDEALPKPYPFNFCIVKGEEFDPYKEPYTITHEGQQYKVCCKDCIEEFRKNPSEHVEKFRALQKRLSANVVSEAKTNSAHAARQHHHDE